MTNQSVSSKLEPWHDLSGKVVMVTGASSGLGRDFCIDLAKSGCRIIAAARRIDRLVSLCDEINQLGRNGGAVTPGNCEIADDVRAVAVELDLSGKGPAIEASVKKAWQAFGRIDGLINNAGVRGNHSILHPPPLILSKIHKFVIVVFNFLNTSVPWILVKLLTLNSFVVFFNFILFTTKLHDHGMMELQEYDI